MITYILLYAGWQHYISFIKAISPTIIIKIPRMTISIRAARPAGFPSSFLVGPPLNLAIRINNPNKIINEAIIIVSVESVITKSIQLFSVYCP